MHLLPEVSADHLAAVLRDLSPEDAAELVAAGVARAPGSFQPALDQAIVQGVAVIGDQPVAIFGCIPDPRIDGAGIPWMIATSSLRRDARSVMRLSRLVVDQMQVRYAYLHNWVHNRHDVALRWLAWLGFDIGADRVGPDGEFLHFQWSRHV